MSLWTGFVARFWHSLGHSWWRREALSVDVNDPEMTAVVEKAPQVGKVLVTGAVDLMLTTMPRFLPAVLEQVFPGIARMYERVAYAEEWDEVRTQGRTPNRCTRTCRTTARKSFGRRFTRRRSRFRVNCKDKICSRPEIGQHSSPMFEQGVQERLACTTAQASSQYKQGECLRLVRSLFAARIQLHTLNRMRANCPVLKSTKARGKSWFHRHLIHMSAVRTARETVNRDNPKSGKARASAAPIVARLQRRSWTESSASHAWKSFAVNWETKSCAYRWR
jgi:hypothetical protein